MNPWDHYVQEILDRPHRRPRTDPITDPSAHPDFKCCGPTEFVYDPRSHDDHALGPLIRCTTCRRTWRQS